MYLYCLYRISVDKLNYETGISPHGPDEIDTDANRPRAILSHTFTGRSKRRMPSCANDFRPDDLSPVMSSHIPDLRSSLEAKTIVKLI